MALEKRTQKGKLVMSVLSNHKKGFEKNCLNCILENIKNALERKPIDVEVIDAMKYFLIGKKTGIETTDNAIQKLQYITDYGSEDFKQALSILDMDEQIQYHKLVPKNQRYKYKLHDQTKVEKKK